MLAMQNERVWRLVTNATTWALHDRGSQGDGTVALSFVDVALSSVFLLISTGISIRLRLGLHAQLLLAGVRCVVQLTVLGLVLGPVFKSSSPWPAILYAIFMLVVATLEAASRPHYTFPGLLSNTFLAVATTASATTLYAMLVVLRVRPWWQAQYLVPVLGMVLGSTITGISVGLSALLEEVSTGKDRIEILLSLGATRWEATHDVIQRCARLALTPLINAMSVMGVVSIPGMMTGQILGGSSPTQAARYQIMIMFLLGGTSAMATTATIYLAVMRLLDGSHRLLASTLQPHTPEPGLFIFLQLPFVIMFLMFGLASSPAGGS